MASINAFSGGEKVVTDNLVQDALLNEHFKLGMKREIMMTNKGLKWCKENCN